MDCNAFFYVNALGTVFKVHANKHDTILKGEYALSIAVLAKGWGIASTQAAYTGVVFRKPDKASLPWTSCNGGVNPSRGGSYFGISMHPFEVIFHKSRFSGQKVAYAKEEQLLTLWQDRRKNIWPNTNAHDGARLLLQASGQTLG
jgi:hypothetical protein